MSKSKEKMDAKDMREGQKPHENDWSCELSDEMLLQATANVECLAEKVVPRKCHDNSTPDDTVVRSPTPNPSPSDTPSEDDTDRDQDYCPSSQNKDSDSEINSDGFVICVNRKKKRTLTKTRNKGWKRIATNKQPNHSRKRRKISDSAQSHSDSTSDDETLAKVLEKSKKKMNLLQIREKLHNERLSAVLKSNGLKRISVPAHGNCFFEATLRQIKDGVTPEDVQRLRTDICNHIVENKKHYAQFITGLSEDDSQNKFLNMIDDLRKDGMWDSVLGDIVPTALSNLLGVSIVIYSSRDLLPIIHIEPTLGLDSTMVKGKLLFSYLAIPGYEHYDYCSKAEEAGNRDLSHVANNSVRPSRLKDNTETSPMVSPGESGHQQPDPIVDGDEAEVSGCVTPRKNANYKSPGSNRKTRKRKHSEPQKWKKNIRKQLRLSGKEYEMTTGKVRAERRMKAGCGVKCRFRCHSQISQELREGIFSCFWSLSDSNRQNDFICQSTSEAKPSRTRRDGSKGKAVSRIYTFCIDGKQLRVCKQFFCDTLDMSLCTVDKVLQKKSHGIFSGCDQRGQHKPWNKTAHNIERDVCKHIESFPVTESHYTRKDSGRKYLGAELNIKRMFTLYKEKCAMEGKEAVTESVYRRIFCTKYNYAFHHPKKDQCSLCNEYNVCKEAGTLRPELDRNYQDHQKRKIQAREEKERDKKLAQRDDSYHAVTFDLEAVLSTPCSLVSQIYYKRKLSCYNLSIYSLGSKDASCYLWNETEANRGSCEIATCVYLYLKSLPRNVKHVCLYSDTCSGQNRNKYFTAAMMYALMSIPNLQTIDQKFLESGHTQMECDSMHSAIEFAKKKTQIFIPSQWDTVVRMARRKHPYHVVPLKFMDILDFKAYTKTCSLTNFTKDITGRTMNWRKLKWIRVTKEDPRTIMMKENFEDEFTTVKASHSSRRSSCQQEHPSRLYSSKLPISAAKKKDLLSLCREGVIPEDHHSYYQSLPCSATVKDTLPQPDCQDESESDME